MRRVRALLVAALALPWSFGCALDPTAFDPEQQVEVDRLEERLAADPADVDAVLELVDLRAAHLDFEGAEALLDETVAKVTLAPRKLEKLSGGYEGLGERAERGKRGSPDRVDDELAYRLARSADRLRARAEHVARRDRSAVRAQVALAEGTTALLGDVMLRCSNTDLTGSGAIGGHLTFSYYGDRLAVSTAPGPMGSRDLEYRLAGIDLLTVERDPTGELRLTVRPAAWDQRSPPCQSCVAHAPCALLGDRPDGGMTEIEIGQAREVRFQLEALPPLGSRR